MINIGCENRHFATRLTAEIQVAGKYTLLIPRDLTFHGTVIEVMLSFLQKERRVLTRKRTKVSIELTHTQVFCCRLFVVRMSVTKNKLYWCHGYLLVQNADCRPDTECRPSTKF